MPEISPATIAFEEAISFLKEKARLPSQRWDNLRGAIHAKAFTVAGATKAQLLQDLHEAVTAALEQGQSIGEFRKSFDGVAERHGWSYKGHRSWRTRVIYDTNMRTAHMAGRWAQIQETKDRRPYLQYLTAGDTRVRPEHRKWDGTILEVDDEWWNTHYPPNGWGCRCMVRTLSQGQMERAGLTVAAAPEVKLTERVNTRTGEIYGEVPEGIDTGWEYNVGAAWLGPDQALGQAVAQFPSRMRTAALNALQQQADRLAKPYAAWAKTALEQNTAGSAFAVGHLNGETFRALVERGTTPSTSTITVFDFQLRRILREVARRSGKATLPTGVLLTLPARLAAPLAVLWNKQEQNLAFVTELDGDKTGRLVVAVDWAKKGQPFNVVLSGAVVARGRLRDSANYELIEGNP
jgi:SPP1 gp7 family putative phage head morphogenesis protein